MCKFYSAIVMRNGDILHNENLTSHEDLIDLFNIKDNQSNCNKFVRVEFSPNNETDLPDIDKYNLNVDESVCPDWFEKHRERVTDYLKSFVSKRIISGKLNLLTGGLYVVNNAEIGRIKSAVVVFLQNSTVNAMGDNSTVNEMWENSTVNEMYGNSTVNAMYWNSTVKLNNSKNKLPK